MTTTRNSRRTLQGTVHGTEMDKSISVLVERRYAHPKYGKFVRKHKKYLAHDEKNEAEPGDLVEIAATRPLSKRKRWRLVRIVERARFEQGQVPGIEAGRELEAGE